jgi:hypothetical protein
MMFVTWLRRGVLAICVGGIIGMIVGSVRDNNMGIVMTSGIIAAIAMIIQIAVTATVRRMEPQPVPDELQAAEVEARINELVKAGAEERAVRSLVKAARRL